MSLSACIHCEKNAAVVVHMNGPVYTYVCQECGHTFAALVHHVTPQEIAAATSRRAEVTVRWRADRPSVEELVTLRRVYPQFQSLTALELTTTIGRAALLSLGTFQHMHAKHLVR